ncbi:methyl-accepting chemotaxis protein [Cohaesibacter sp. ES.047]|uniref:HAMP domain-containing methyl-accepting chemotaxis protein n=1 Tax=Cohaesibacter sp. ES.047 TaxID=1798205 RepID=UPI000BC01FB7|nr:methyl-accepting chemotaxis protein [Cohaesibacter sp. ES.047]SNY91144.1 methyl-accepting chemotaxis protein [Cohaesibacter sp. ES.047]
MSSLSTNPGLGTGTDHPSSEPGSNKSRSFLSRFKVGSRIYAGFAAVLVLLVCLASFSIISFSNQKLSFSSYSDISEDALLVNNLEGAVLASQLSLKEFYATSDDAEKAEFGKRYNDIMTLMDKANEEIHNPTRVALLDKIRLSLANYKAGFDRVVELADQRNELVYKRLGVAETNIRKNLSDIREGAFAANDYEAASFAGTAQEHLLLARLYVMKFLDDNTQESIDRTLSELSTLDGALTELDASLQNPQRRALLSQVQKNLPDYLQGVKDLNKTILARNSIRDGDLRSDATAIMEASEAIAASADQDQQKLQESVNASLNTAEYLMVIVSAIAFVAGLAAAFFIARGITKPVLSLTSAMGRLANQDYSTVVPGGERGDELGQMARAVDVFKKNGIRAQELEAEQHEREQRAEAEKRKLMMDMAEEFDTQIGTIVNSVSAASEQLNTSAKLMSDVAVETERQATEASAASQQTSSNVQTVATATEEMNSTISEISVQVGNASKASIDAVEKVGATNVQMSTLAETSSKIGAVVEMISQIAEQTNLLALNATIESARAGEAGKGFAVVAAEVKDLAGQTAKATEEIAQQIGEVQSATNQASISMQGVSHAIQQVNEISAAIASAMEEQTAATGEISSSVHQAAQGTEVVNANVLAVSKASEEAGAASGQVMSAAAELGQQSATLKTEVDKFIAQVRAG